MSKTIVGLFKNRDEAQSIKHDLINDGYSADSIRVVDKDGAPVSFNGQTDGAQTKTDSSADTGFAASISSFFRSFTGSDPEDEKHYTSGVESGGSFLAITVPDDRAEATAARLESYGAKSVDEQAGTAKSAKPLTSTNTVGAGQKLDVVEEELVVGKRQVQRGGIRVYSHVAERPVEEQISLRDERVVVERRPVNRAATEADFSAFKEGSIELTETAEEAVVSKQARVVEEVVIGKNVSERKETIKDTVRRTDVEVEKIGGQDVQTAYGPAFRTHYDANYAKSGSPFSLYEPAYNYGHRLASDTRYANSDWSKVESVARTDWAKQGSGTWDDMKAAVRHGWDKVKTTTSTNA